jgi:hypothetical protein
MTAKPSASGQWAEQQKLWQRKEQKKEQHKSSPQRQQEASTGERAPDEDKRIANKS